MRRALLVTALLTLPAAAHARTVTSYNDLAGPDAVTTITFNERSSDNGQSLAALGQPYHKQGLILPSQTLVADANLGGFSGGAAARSTAVNRVGNANVQSLAFDAGVRKVGLTVCDRTALAVVVTAHDAAGAVLDSATFPGGPHARYVGFVRDAADITEVRIEAAHATFPDALESPTLVDDISFPDPPPSGAVNRLAAPPSHKDADSHPALALAATPTSADGSPSSPSPSQSIAPTGANASEKSPVQSRPAPLAPMLADPPADPINDPADDALVRIPDSPAPLTLPDPGEPTPATTARIVTPLTTPPPQQTVPEPTAIAIALLTVPVLMAQRRREMTAKQEKQDRDLPD